MLSSASHLMSFLTMEEAITLPYSTLTTPSPKLPMHNTSHVISKFKPKIRIVHIFAPEIIKTDVANFRELVQRLTGKPAARRKKTNKLASRKFSNTSIHDANKSMQLQDGFWSCFLKGKEEINETWATSDTSSCFLDGFTDLDGFIQELK